VSDGFALTVPASLAESIAERAAEIVLTRLCDQRLTPASPYLTVDEAADHLRCSRQRIYDLCSARRLTRYKDGRRLLVSRAELDEHLTREGAWAIAPTLPPPGGTA
jgi:excisionase family DNA binding protein